MKMSLKLVIALALIAVVWCEVPYEPAFRTYWTDAFKQLHESFVNITKTHAERVKVVFLGDSITQGWGDTGKKVWDAHYANRGAVNYGIGGDQTQHVLWRVLNGEFDGLTPKLVVLKIGTNNLGGNTVADIAKGVHAILDALHTKVPNAKILLLSILPRQPEKDDQKVHEINALIKRFADNKQVLYLDLAVHFEISLGHEIAELFNSDHLHLSENGYKMWYKVMEPSFKELTA